MKHYIDGHFKLKSQYSLIKAFQRSHTHTELNYWHTGHNTAGILTQTVLCSCKGKVHPRTGHDGPERENRYSSTLSLTSALDGGGWSTPRPGRFTPGNVSVPVVQEAGWALGPVWTGAENLAPTGIRSPDSPARSESLYRLSYRGPHCVRV
jgi:hypothetical protein